MSKKLNKLEEQFTSNVKPSREVGKKSFKKKKTIYRPKFKHPLKEI